MSREQERDKRLLMFYDKVDAFRSPYLLGGVTSKCAAYTYPNYWNAYSFNLRCGSYPS